MDDVVALGVSTVSKVGEGDTKVFSDSDEMQVSVTLILALTTVFTSASLPLNGPNTLQNHSPRLLLET